MLVMLKSGIHAAALCALAGCAKSPAVVDPALAGRAEAFIKHETGAPEPATVTAVWRGEQLSEDGFVCGRIQSPPPLRAEQPTLRFVYADGPSTFGQVERHRYWVSGDMIGTAILAQNRELFDNLWKNNCAPGDPERSWWRGWSM